MAIALMIIAFQSALSAGFVWDDDAQIVQNKFLRDGGRFWQAVTSDVWAFKDGLGEPRSSYWRPLFVLWLMLDYRLFGLEPMGWHAACLLLHGAVLVLAAEVLRQLRVGLGVSAATLWLFAAHPVHTESVVWISGSTDPLLAVFLLGSYLTYLAGRRVVSPLLFALALLAKETAVLFPVLIFVSEWLLGARGTFGSRVRQAALGASAHVGVLAAYSLVRLAVLGRLVVPATAGEGVLATLLTLPRLTVVYSQHLVWPARLSPVYAFRAVTPETLSLLSFVLPLVALSMGATIGFWLWRRDAVSRISIAMSIVFLLPATNLALLSPDRLIHDRYLYLPSFGALLLIAHTLSRLTTDRAILVVGGMLGMVLCIPTIRYARAWSDDVALWEHAVTASPESALALSNLGYHYRETGRNAEARQVLTRALEIDARNTQALVDLGLVDMNEARYAAAERGFRVVLAIHPDHEVALERLGVAVLAQGRTQEAMDVFDETRRRLPHLKVRATVNIASLLMQSDRPALALAELESITGDLQGETDAEMLRGYFYLGELYLAEGRANDARQAYEQYLRRTAWATGPMAGRLRIRAAERLTELATPSP